MQTMRTLRDSKQTDGPGLYFEVGGPATFKDELPAPREALIEAVCAKCREGV